jgi:hypothetical protein
VSLDNGGKLDQLMAEYRRLRPEGMTAEEKRESAISFVLGNLNLSSRHKTTREDVEAAWDKI